MITLEHEELVFRFPEVHKTAECGICFERTLRIPDDGKTHPLPPGLGHFPLRHIEDFSARMPVRWQKRGGVIMPMYQAEAMWMNFGMRGWDGSYPFAIKIGTGKINAITGEKWTNNLNSDPQDYAVLPDQPWLDGFCSRNGTIRQFVAMPLGEGYSVEEQLTNDAEHGGVQIIAYPMKAERFEKLRESQRANFDNVLAISEPCADMALAPGGSMKQDIYEDPYGLDAWDQRHSSRCFVTIANSLMWQRITGECPPTEPPTAADYTRAGLPWFDYYGNDATALEGSDELAKAKSVKELGAQKGVVPLPENESIQDPFVVQIEKRKKSNFAPVTEF